MKKFKIVFTILLLTLAMAQKIKAQDWPNLNRFKIENEKLIASKSTENRVVFMGNSITEGWGTMTPEFFQGKPYINRGIGGQTTPQMLLRFRADVIHLKPKVVVILAGTNDIAGNTGPSTLEMIADNLFSMTELAKANHIKVVLCSVLPAFDYPWKTGLEPAEKITTLNLMISDYAKQNKITYVDYHSAMKDNRNGLKIIYSEDGVHPNGLGYKIMAPLVEIGIAKALEGK